MAESDGSARDDATPQRNRWIWLLLLLLLLGGAIAYVLLRPGPDVHSPAEAGGFELTFTGADSAGREAIFKVVAPGQAYRWELGRDEIADLPEGARALADVLAADLAISEGVILTGLASREGPDGLNRALASCRSLVLASELGVVQSAADTDAQPYRLVLGRYEDDGEEENTDIERLLVFGFVLEAEEGVNLDQALRQGLLESLPAALDDVLAPLARQLDFTRYACWDDAFAVTPAGDQRVLCYRERSVDPADFCSRF